MPLIYNGSHLTSVIDNKLSTVERVFLILCKYCQVSRKAMYLELRYSYYLLAGLGGSVRCASDWWSGDCGFDPRRVGNILSWRFDHETFSTVILSLPLIQEGQLSVSGERMCTMLVNRLED